MNRKSETNGVRQGPTKHSRDKCRFYGRQVALSRVMHTAAWLSTEQEQLRLHLARWARASQHTGGRPPDRTTACKQGALRWLACVLARIEQGKVLARVLVWARCCAAATARREQQALSRAKLLHTMIAAGLKIAARALHRMVCSEIGAQLALWAAAKDHAQWKAQEDQFNTKLQSAAV